MVIPVNTARQCLTPEASRTLDEAVNIAHRRCHAQTTSLHVISAFLSLPSSSILRDACTRTRNTAYSPRVQFKALELCFGVALDRLPASSSHNVDESPEPPISNSLMAAIKRSQANQRRNPETFHLHQMQLQQQQHQQQQSSSLSCVKVEPQQFLLSILDDPVVSRVFGEAGFRSYEIKFAIVRPSPSFLRYSNSPYAPLFLCNLTGSDYEMGRRSLISFPFSGYSEHSEKEHNCRRIAEILSRKKGRNPLLVGVCAKDAILSFTETLKNDKGDSFLLPVEISGLSFICIEKEVSEFITHQTAGCEGILGSRFEELNRLLAESCSGPGGVVVSFGDLKSFITEEGGSVVNATSYVISKLTKLLELHSGNLWLMGAAMNYEMYSRFLTKFPSAEKDWDLQLLPITSLKPSMGGYYSRPHSLMESFVPLGGFFSTPSNLKCPSGSTFQSVSRCQLCTEKYEQEVSAILKGGSPVSVANRYQASLPLWLQTAELTTSKELDVSKAKDDGTVLNTQVTGLQTKWNEICQRLHHRFQVAEGDVKRLGSQVLPRIVGFPFVTDKKHEADNDHSTSTNAPPHTMGPENISPSMPVELQTTSPETTNMSIRDQVASFTKNKSSLPKLNLRPSNGEHLQREGLWSASCSLSNILDGHASPSSATSVTTDLGLGTLYSSTCLVPKKPSPQAQEECLQSWSLCQPAVSGSIPIPPAQSPLCSGTGLSEQFDPRDFKTLLRGLTEKVGRQDEAIHAISRTIACCRTGKERRRGLSLKGDVWFSFLGPDYVAKKKLAVALAEIIFGDGQSLICVDLASQDGFSRPNIIFDCQEINGYDVNFRGKTVVDYIACEIKKKPLSVVFLENVDKADLLAQKCLLEAIRTGKFSDTHGREIGINNAIFVVTTGVMKDTETLYSRKEPINFSEEKILEAQAWQMKILIRNGPEGTTISQKSNVLVPLSKCTSGLAYLNKRKLIDTANRKELCENSDTAKRSHTASNRYLDLNKPIQDSEATETDFGPNATGSISENSEAWLENFFHLVDEAVIFEPYDFDTVADELLKKISESFQNTIGHKGGLLEIDSKVMEQILAATWLSDKRRVVEYWVKQVLVRSFIEIQEKHSLKAGFVLKLVTCEGHPLDLEKQAPGIYLPAKINMSIMF